MAESTDLTPLEWLARLGKRIVARRPRIDYWRRYYDGDHDLPAGPSQHREAYRRFQKLARTNLCRLCAESMVHRMQVVGFHSESDPEGAAWRLWQDARLDGRQFGLFRKAVSRSVAYAIVGPDPRDQNRPLVTIEGPETVIVETDPADPTRRLAALRLWHDSIAQRWSATLYLPGVRYHWQTAQRAKSGLAGGLSFKPAAWEARSPGTTRSLPGEIPVIPFACGDEDDEPTAAFDSGIDVQNRLNLTLLNRLTSERYSAFRQKGLSNFVPDEDPATGLPIAPFNLGADQILTLPPPEAGQPEPKLFEFAQTDTSQIIRAVEADMRAFAAVTLTPVYYLPGDLINVGSDAVAALDAGHIAKLRQQMTLWGEGLEEVIGLMATIAGLDLDLTQGEIVWARPENFQPAVTADYASKLVAAGYPLPVVAERIGDTPQQIAQLRAEMAADQARAIVGGRLL